MIVRGVVVQGVVVQDVALLRISTLASGTEFPQNNDLGHGGEFWNAPSEALPGHRSGDQVTGGPAQTDVGGGGSSSFRGAVVDPDGGESINDGTRRQQIFDSKTEAAVIPGLTGSNHGHGKAPTSSDLALEGPFGERGAGLKRAVNGGDVRKILGSRRLFFPRERNSSQLINPHDYIRTDSRDVTSTVNAPVETHLECGLPLRW